MRRKVQNRAKVAASVYHGVAHGWASRLMWVLVMRFFHMNNHFNFMIRDYLNPHPHFHIHFCIIQKILDRLLNVTIKSHELKMIVLKVYIIIF